MGLTSVRDLTSIGESEAQAIAEERSPGWREAQESVIGSMLIDARCIGPVMLETDAGMFSVGSYREIYSTIRQMWNDHQVVDPVTVLRATGKDYGDLFAELMRRTPTAAHVLEYTQILRDCEQMQLYSTAASEILFRCGTAAEAAAVWEKLGRELMGAQKVRCVSLQEAIGNYLDRMNEDSPPDYFSLGISQLDKILRIGRGKFVILAADSSAGKTALALQFAYHIAETGKKVGFFSLETDNETLTDRLMAQMQVAAINLPRTKLKALTTADYQRAIDAGQKSARVDLSLIDSCETIDEIRTWTVQKGFDVIVVDYLQLINAEGEKRWDIVTNISMQLHRMAQKLGVTVIGLSQVTPPDKGGSKALTMDDLRESRQLKHDADVILILERTDEFPDGRTLTIAKNKDGKRNRGMKLQFDPEHMTFSYYRRVTPSAVAGQVEYHELPDDDEEVPF